VISLPIEVAEGEEHTYLHYLLPLKQGENSFTLTPDGGRFEINFEEIRGDLALMPFGMEVSLFHRDDKLPDGCIECHDVQESKVVAPTGLKKQISCGVCHKSIIAKGSWKHGPTLNQQCLNCHQRSIKPWKIGFPLAKDNVLCLSCHTSKRAWFSRKITHGPINLGGCTLCHNPHGENHKYQLWAEGSLALCLSCHSDMKTLVNKTPSVHGIIFGKGCVACHDPHASDEVFMLLKPINELCVSCHITMKGVVKGHPVARHPISGPRENLRSNRKLECTSCHNPHGSANNYMLTETQSGGRLCRGCHK
jgi:predicted CXXCH cytochrome family protein